MANANITDWKITVDQLEEQIGIEIRRSMDKYFDTLLKHVSTHPMSGTELGEKAKDAARKNIALVRDYTDKLSRAKDFMAVVPIHTEFTQSLLALFGEQIKTLGEVYSKAATEVLNAPLYESK